MENFPIYLAEISDENDGVLAVSLVSEPATEVNWLVFNKQESFQFTVDDTKHCLTAPLMLADTPIYRRDNSGYEYYIKYEKETLRKMCEKMLKDNTFNEIDLQHDGEIIEKGKVNLLELYIKDEAKPSPFGDEVPMGSIICTYKINDDALWKECTEGVFHGFSLEGLFTIEKVENNNKQDKEKNMYSKIKEVLAKILTEFTEINADEGTLIIEGELAVNAKVTEGEDGVYHYDGKVITVKDGIVESIEDVEVEEETTEEETEEAVEAEEETVEETEEDTVEEVVDETPSEVEQLKGELDALKAEIEAIKNQLAEIVSTPQAEPIAEEFNKITSTPKDVNLGVFASLRK